MNTRIRFPGSPALTLGLTLGLAATFASAAPLKAQVEVEVDPIAYALNGFSLHLAKVIGPTRLNVGTFGIDIPSAFHGNDGWNSSMRGAGVKWDYTGTSSDGFFAGIDGGYMRTRYSIEGELPRVTRDIIGVGVRTGYRQPIGRRGLYVAPWVGVSYQFDGDDVSIGDHDFDRSAIVIFPTVHVGWRF
jgi:hypothetical protein